jgi:NTE family protein
MEICLALGGGGTKGFAHLGVLHCLEREGYIVRGVAGTSAGGIVGSIYAAGYPPKIMLERLRKVDQSHLYGRQPGDGPSLLGVVGIHHLLTEMLGERTFNDLHIPLALTAVDFNSCKEVVLNQGRVVDAVLAAIALPGIFPPQEMGDWYLLDGGLLDPVPVAPARSLAPILPVVAVALYAPHVHAAPHEEPPIFWHNIPLLKQITRLRVAQAFNIFLHSLEISGSYITETRLQLDKPDVIIRVEIPNTGLLDRVDLDDLFQRGEQAAEKALPEIHQALSLRRRLERLWRYRKGA